MSSTTASAPTSKEDTAALQSEHQGTEHQTVDDQLKAGSHASKAQVDCAPSACLHVHVVYVYASYSVCCLLQASHDKAAHDQSVAETGAKPMKREAKPQI